MRLAQTQQTVFQLELFSMPIHEKLTIQLLWAGLPSRTLVYLNQQKPAIKKRAKELIDRHFNACLIIDIMPEDGERAVWEAVKEAELEAIEPDAAEWYESVPLRAFEGFARKYHQYVAPLKDVA